VRQKRGEEGRRLREYTPTLNPFRRMDKCQKSIRCKNNPLVRRKKDLEKKGVTLSEEYNATWKETFAKRDKQSAGVRGHRSQKK